MRSRFSTFNAPLMLTEGATPLHRVADLNAAPPQCHFTAIAHRDQFFRRHAIDDINTTLLPAGRADIFADISGNLEESLSLRLGKQVENCPGLTDENAIDVIIIEINLSRRC